MDKGSERKRIGISARAAAMCAVFLAAALFVGASAVGVAVGSGRDGEKTDGSSLPPLSSGEQTAGAMSASFAPQSGRARLVEETEIAVGEGDADSSPAGESALADAGGSVDDVETVGSVNDTANDSAANVAGEPEYIPADGSRFAVMYAPDDGVLLFDAVSLARLAGATEVSIEDGALRASGGGFDLSAGEDDSYILSAGRAFWTGRAPIFEDGGAYIPAAPLAAALGFTIWDDGAGRVTLTGGAPIESADAHYDAGALYWLSRIIYAESGCEPMLGKVAVGNVVLNRVRSDAYPDTIYGVIFDRRFGTVQFTPTASGTIYLEPSQDAVIAAKLCLEGFSVSDEIEFFFNPAIAESTWISDNRPWIMTIANHEFYG